MKDFFKILLFTLLFLGMFVFWASQCSAQTTFTRDRINTTTFTVLGSERLFFSTDSTAPSVGYVKIWARDSTTLYLIRSSGVKVNLLASAVDTSILATQYDISLKSVAFGTIDTSGLAVNKILKWSGSAWIIRSDSVGSGAADSTTWIATDYDVSLKLAKTDTASLSNRINLKLTATDTASLSTRINTKLTASDTTSLSDRVNLKLAATDTASLSTRINLRLLGTDTLSLSNRINLRLSGTDTVSLSDRINLKLSKVDTASMSTRINLKLTSTDTASLSNRINAIGAAGDTTSLSNRINAKLAKVDTASLSTRINLKLTATDTASLSSRIDLKLTATDTASLSTRINTKLTATDTASLSTRINAKPDSSLVLYWSDTTLANGVATNSDLVNFPSGTVDSIIANVVTLGVGDTIYTSNATINTGWEGHGSWFGDAAGIGGISVHTFAGGYAVRSSGIGDNGKRVHVLLTKR